MTSEEKRGGEQKRGEAVLPAEKQAMRSPGDDSKQLARRVWRYAGERRKERAPSERHTPEGRRTAQDGRRSRRGEKNGKRRGESHTPNDSNRRSRRGEKKKMSGSQNREEKAASKGNRVLGCRWHPMGEGETAVQSITRKGRPKAKSAPSREDRI